MDNVSEQLQVLDARCTGTLFRGFETLLKGRDPWDAPVITERICGVCPVSHGMAAVKALDAAAGIVPPTDGRVSAQLGPGSKFYPVAHSPFLSAGGPGLCSRAKQCPMDPCLGCGHEVRKRWTGLSPSICLWPLRPAGGHTKWVPYSVEGCRHPIAYIPGGFTAVPQKNLISEFKKHLKWLLDFTRNVYIPDVLALAGIYEDYYKIGQGSKKLLAYGVFDLEDTLGGEQLLNGGISEVGCDRRF